MYYLADFSKLNQTDQQPKKESEKNNRWKDVGLIAGGGLAVPIGSKIGGAFGMSAGLQVAKNTKKYKQTERIINKVDNYNRGKDFWKPAQSKGYWTSREVADKILNKGINIGNTTGRIAGGLLAGAGTYGAYRAGKSIYNRVLKRGKKNDKK